MNLPPLDPDAYLAWLHRKVKGPGRPFTLDEWAFAMDMTVAEARKSIIGMAAFARKWARLERLGYHNPLKDHRT